jgi:gamma-glutamylcyclotransferase (GGCT)/AIG2-like uncharacterized protein YtfP
LNPEFGAEFVRIAEMLGPYRMVDLGAFPGVVQHSDYAVPGNGGCACIIGEIWKVSQDVLAALDMLEGNKFFYTRQKVRFHDGKAWCYFLPHDEYDTAKRVPVIGARTYCWRPSKEELQYTEHALPDARVA